MKKSDLRILFAFLICMILIFSTPSCSLAVEPNMPIKHVVVIIQENHTFDNYFGKYPKVNGLNSIVALPLVVNHTDLVVKPFHLSVPFSSEDLSLVKKMFNG